MGGDRFGIAWGADADWYDRPAGGPDEAIALWVQDGRDE